MRATNWDAGFPADRMLPALRGTLDGPRRRPRRAGERPPRRREAADEGPARVLRADRGAGQGDARDPAARAAPTTGARSSTRPATPSTSRTRRRALSVEEKRLGDNAVTEGWAMLFEHLTDDRGGSRSMLDFPRPQRVRGGRRRRCSSTSCAATARSSSTRSSSTRPTTRRRCAAATSSSRRRAQDHARARGLPLRHRRRLLRRRLPPRLGVRGAADDVPAREVRPRLVHAARGRLAPARALVARVSAERGRAAARGHRRVDRDGIGRRARARERRLALQRQERGVQHDAKRRLQLARVDAARDSRRTRASTRRFSTRATRRAARSA